MATRKKSRPAAKKKRSRPAAAKKAATRPARKKNPAPRRAARRKAAIRSGQVRRPAIRPATRKRAAAPAPPVEVRPAPRARDVMTLDVLFVEDDMTLDELASFLTDHEISGAAVRDRSGKLVGVVSLTDLAAVASGGVAPMSTAGSRAFYDQSWEDVIDEWDSVTITLPQEGEMRVTDIMTPTVLTVDADASVTEVAATMLDSHVHRLLVHERASDQVVGIVTTSDLLSVLAERRP